LLGEFFSQIDFFFRFSIGLLSSPTVSAAKQLWQSLPAVYRQCAICYTDFWESYEQVLPSKRHRAVGKETGKTSYIERFNNTLRQRVGRLVRKTLSLSCQVNCRSILQSSFQKL
jgi:IS1 family transposase